jgi:hypothetical protein
MRARNSKEIIFSILFGISLMLPSSIGAEETKQVSDWVPREPGYALKSGGYAPHTDWSRFHRVLIHPIDVAYTTEFKEASLTDYPNEFGSKDLERARRYFQRAFQKRMSREYPIATTPGRDVLRVDAVLVNPVLDKTWWLKPGKSAYRGEASFSLVVVLRDSETGTPLHKVKLPMRVGFLGFEDSAINYWGYLRLVFDRVATRVRWSLEEAPDSTNS